MGRRHSHPQPTTLERSDLRDPLVVAIDVDDTEAVVQGGLGDQQVGNRGAMPHAVVVCQVSLQVERTIEDIGWYLSAGKGRTELGGDLVVLGCRSRRIPLLELPDRADVQRPGELPQF